LFENIIAQPAADQLKADILSQQLAPCMLFFGPQASGKGSAAIELARSLSCEEDAAWNCTCASCARHRVLIHADLAMLGPRGFAAEIAASRSAFLRDTSSVPGRALFIRSVRKLLARFAPAVWEYESRSGKTNPLPLLQSLEEDLDEFESATQAAGGSFEKLTAALAKNACKLEDECISESIPIAQVRKAAWWCRLSPAGKQKTLIIENADRMEEKARNALLKLLEEPPQSVSILLTAQRREAVMPTILSRLRPYRFISRSADQEREIIRRVFREPAYEAPDVSQGMVSAYLDTFLPQPSEKLLPLAAFFVAAVARSSAAFSRNHAGLSPAIVAMGSYCAQLAEAAGFNRTAEARETIAVLLSHSGNFEGRSFPRFLSLALDLVSRSLAQCSPGTFQIQCREIWKTRLEETRAAYSVWNQRPELALEALFCRLREDTRHLHPAPQL
jgi:DNA polymerase-3 subunit gamma/tau